MTDQDLVALDKARDALSRHAWSEAYELLAAGVAECDDPDQCELFAEAAWWMSRLDDCIRARERVYRSCEAIGDRRRAAQAAMLLFDNHCFKGQRSVANGWLGRAKRLLDDDTECVEAGNLLLRHAESAHSAGDLVRAADCANRSLELGRRLADADLQAESLQCLGRILIVEGRPADGLALYDEAMLAAVEGRLSPFLAGKIYCSLISACEELGDVRRAAEWSEIASRWASSHPFSAFPGLCRVHRAEVLKLRGEWRRAEEEADLARCELDGVNAFNTALCFREIGDIRCRLGDLEGADQAYARAIDLGLSCQPGLALLRLAQGRTTVAAAMIVQALGETSWNQLERAKLLPAAVRIAVAVHDPTTARESADELDAIAARYRSCGIEAAATSARGRVHLAEGDAVAACSTFRRALQQWQTIDAPYEAATARMLLGAAMRAAGDDEAAEASFASARTTFERLGARLDLAEAERLCSARTSAPDGLTQREVEVLRLVAAGQTNKAIALGLSLSEKTVARHLSNIFRKLDVPSRAAATAYAFEHALVGSHR